MIQEFKKFALKGNMIDMAVGIIIGAAFATVIKSLVDDVLMPIIQKPDFSNLFVMLRNPAGETFASVEAARNAGAAVLGYGLFINALIAFLIVAFVLFVIVKNMNKLMEKKAEEAAKPAAPPQPSAQEVLLSEIRDILKSQKSTS
jgi:large conductance mechanosensitive channel